MKWIVLVLIIATPDIMILQVIFIIAAFVLILIVASSGASKILAILNSKMRNLRVPAGADSYLKLMQYVAVPEVVIQLIMEDKSLDYDSAHQVWQDSKNHGPVDDDCIYYSDSD